jgi:hypothetical protein
VCDFLLLVRSDDDDEGEMEEQGTQEAAAAAAAAPKRRRKTVLRELSALVHPASTALLGDCLLATGERIVGAEQAAAALIALLSPQWPDLPAHLLRRCTASVRFPPFSRVPPLSPATRRAVRAWSVAVWGGCAASRHAFLAVDADVWACIDAYCGGTGSVP